MPVNGVAVAAAGISLVFVYGGITGKSPLQAAVAVIRGTNPTGIAQSQPITNGIASVAGDIPTTSSPSGGSPISSTGTKNMAIGKLLAAGYGWNTGQEWSDLVSLWNKESGWSNTADTRKTHSGGDTASSTVFAYGVAQARPAEKYPLAGQPPDLGGQADPTAQITWGLNYIKQVYGDPIAAWVHETQHNWY